MNPSPTTETPNVPPIAAPVELRGTAPYETGTAMEEGRFLNYVGHQIPWYVRALWLIFWIGSAWYVIRWLLPALQGELLSSP